MECRREVSVDGCFISTQTVMMSSRSWSIGSSNWYLMYLSREVQNGGGSWSCCCNHLSPSSQWLLYV
jgi:hypothetical protein